MAESVMKVVTAKTTGVPTTAAVIVKVVPAAVFGIPEPVNTLKAFPAVLFAPAAAFFEKPCKRLLVLLEREPPKACVCPEPTNDPRNPPTVPPIAAPTATPGTPPKKNPTNPPTPLPIPAPTATFVAA
jgi:hypothetical protein